MKKEFSILLCSNFLVEQRNLSRFEETTHADKTYFKLKLQNNTHVQYVLL